MPADDGSTVRVCARFRPPNKVELAEGGEDCVKYKSDTSVTLIGGDEVIVLCHSGATILLIANEFSDGGSYHDVRQGVQAHRHAGIPVRTHHDARVRFPVCL